jgi:polyhydroxyalkanoate synthesis regulator phasin
MEELGPTFIKLGQILSTRSDLLPDPSIRELLEQSVLMGLGAVSLTRETAQNLVDEMVKRGQAQREEASDMVEQLIQRGEKERNALRKLIREEVHEVLRELQLPTHADMKAVERKLDAILQKLEATPQE